MTKEELIKEFREFLEHELMIADCMNVGYVRVERLRILNRIKIGFNRLARKHDRRGTHTTVE